MNKISLAKLPKKIIEVFSYFNNYGETRLVGGAVRDLILDLHINDYDFATKLTPVQIIDLLKEKNYTLNLSGLKFGSISFFVNNNLVNITSLRRDILPDGRHTKIDFCNSWQEDASRRDFTINALYCDINGEIFDYYYGINDLKKNKVKFIGDPFARIREDYLRILRFIRFSILYSSTFEENDLHACIALKTNLTKISGERIKQEVEKIFLSKKFDLIEQIIGLNLFSEIFEFHSLNRVKNYFHNLAIFFQNYRSYLFWGNFLFDNRALFNFPYTKKENKISKILKEYDFQWFSDSYNQLKLFRQQLKENFVDFITSSFPEKYDYMLFKQCMRLINITPKKLPIKGSDLTKLEVASNSDIAKLLDYGEKFWYLTEYSLTSKQLLKILFNYKMHGI